MKGSIMVVVCFVAGILVGRVGWIPAELIPSGLTTWLLYILIVQVGLGIGASGHLSRVRKELNWRVLLIPAGTVVGTLLFSILAALILGWLPVTDALAVGSGLGYYSLSSIIITELKAPQVGMHAAATLGALALLSNIGRELIALTFAPLLRRYFGKEGVVAAAGVTSPDVLLPSIIRYSGQEMASVAIINGVVLEATVPLLVSFFCSL